MSPAGPSNSRVRFTSSTFFHLPDVAISRPVGHRELEPLIPELKVLCDVVASAVGRNAGLGGAPKQFVNRNSECVANQIPQRQIDPADGINRNASLTVWHG